MNHRKVTEEWIRTQRAVDATEAQIAAMLRGLAQTFAKEAADYARAAEFALSRADSIERAPRAGRRR